MKTAVQRCAGRDVRGGRGSWGASVRAGGGTLGPPCWSDAVRGDRDGLGRKDLGAALSKSRPGVPGEGPPSLRSHWPVEGTLLLRGRFSLGGVEAARVPHRRRSVTW